MATNSLDVVNVYPLSNYKIDKSLRWQEPKMEKDITAAARLARAKTKYMEEGMRTSVGAVLLVQKDNHSHVLLLQDENSFCKLPGGWLKPGESEIQGLKRKLLSKLAVNSPSLPLNWQVGECVAVWWRPDFESVMLPYCPLHITEAKECKKLFIVHLPERECFSVPRNLKLVTVPLFELHDNVQRYGPIISTIPQQLSRFQLIKLERGSSKLSSSLRQSNSQVSELEQRVSHLEMVAHEILERDEQDGLERLAKFNDLIDKKIQQALQEHDKKLAESNEVALKHMESAHQEYKAEEVPGMGFHITQPGSSVATSLIDGEAKPKHVLLLEIKGNQYRPTKIPLKSVRPFEYAEVVLKDEADVDPNDQTSVLEQLDKIVRNLIEKSSQLTTSRSEPKLPLVRIKVDYSGFSTINPQRFGQKYVGKVANPQDILIFSKSAKKRQTTGDHIDDSEKLRPEELNQQTIEALVAESNLKMEILPVDDLDIALHDFVNKDDKMAFYSCLQRNLEETRNKLKSRKKI